MRAAWRAYSLAGLAVEEVSKAGSLAALAAMPENLRAGIGQALARLAPAEAGQGHADRPVQFSAACRATRFVTMALSVVAQILDNARAFAEDTDQLKQRGLCMDVDRGGQIREPPPRPTLLVSRSRCSHPSASAPA